MTRPPSKADYAALAKIPALAERLVDRIDALDTVDGLELLREIRDVNDRLKDAATLIGIRLAEVMDTKEITLSDGTIAERRRSARRTSYEHEALAAAVVEVALVDVDTGEVAEATPVVWRVRDALMAAGHVDYWRKGALAEIGIDLDEYVHREPGRLKIEFRTEPKP